MPDETFKRVHGPWPGVPEGRRRVMQANKHKDTVPEMQVRRMLHAMGYRFRLHRRDLPGRPDLVFPWRRAVIQVHGCFWHQHPGCAHAHVPKSRQDYWCPKFARNVERDHANERRLKAARRERLAAKEQADLATAFTAMVRVIRMYSNIQNTRGTLKWAELRLRTDDFKRAQPWHAMPPFATFPPEVTFDEKEESLDRLFKPHVDGVRG